MFRSGLKAYICYDNHGKLIPSSLVVVEEKPKNGNWIEMPMRLNSYPHPVFRTFYNRAFIRYDNSYWIIPGSLKISRSIPSIGKWYEVPMSVVCCTTTTTTTLAQ
jgi:hypothetical protein